jgi:type I restriction enzyme S subunit
MFCCAAHHHSYIGKKVTLVLVGSIKAIPTPEVMVCRSQDDHLLPGYLAEFLRSPWGYWQIQRTVKGITAHTYSNDVKRIVIPVIPPEIQEQIDRALREANQLIVKSRALVREAKADVEALIEGRLDVEGIVAGRVQPPAWEDVEV